MKSALLISVNASFELVGELVSATLLMLLAHWKFETMWKMIFRRLDVVREAA